MPTHSNFTVRDQQDLETTLIAIMVVIRVTLEKTEIDLDRVRQLIATLVKDDVNMRARAGWLAEYMVGARDTEGHTF